MVFTANLSRPVQIWLEVPEVQEKVLRTWAPTYWAMDFKDDW